MTHAFAFRPYRLPLRPALRTAHGPWTEREGILVRVEDASGRAGFGEIAPIAWFGTETLAEAQETCRQLGDNLTPEKLAAIPARLACVRFALDCALAGIPSMKRGAQGAGCVGSVREDSSKRESSAPPVAARHPSPEGIKSRLPVTALLPAGRDALTVLPSKLEAGYLSFKWKVGVGAADDELALFDDLLAALPSYAKLRLDANGAWDRRTAAKWLARCADRPLEFVEQPVRPDDEAGLLGLATDYPVTLALDESVTGLAAAQRWQGRGWRGVYVIKPALAGPLPELVEWVTSTQSDVVLSSAIETAVARAAILRVALTQPLTKRALGFGIGEIFADRRWDGPVLGPVLDASWLEGADVAAAWAAAET